MISSPGRSSCHLKILGVDTPSAPQGNLVSCLVATAFRYVCLYQHGACGGVVLCPSRWTLFLRGAWHVCGHSVNDRMQGMLVVI